ncbi:MAG: hypothetical protein LQ338_002684 [Usnochroma carphineum]|nr:MAG: hypothetical protein LQ338_002684 [Usnochroma carphineum]
MASPFARPRDKGGTSTANGYANSNSTTAKFLGGPQKSWMTAQKASAAQPCQALPMSQPGQISPGAIFPGALRQRPGNQQYCGTTKNPVDGAGSGSRHSPLNSQSPQERVSPPRSFDKALQKDSSGASINAETVLPSPAPSDELRTDSFQNVEPGANGQLLGGHAGQAQTHRSESAANHRDVEDWNNGVPNTDLAISPVIADATVPHSPQPRTGTLGWTGANQTFGQGALLGKRKHLASGSVIDRATARPSGTVPSTGIGADSPVPSHNRYRPSDVQMRSFIGAIMNRQQKLACQGSEGRDTELGRLRLLQSACAQDDHHYLLLHQIYCMYPKFLNEAHQLSVRFGPEHFRGLEMLTPLLLSNAKRLTNDATDWFAMFPLPFEKLIHDFQIYCEALNHVKSCLAKLAHSWVGFQQHCRKRRCPPFVDELVSSIGVESPVLQSVVFRAIHKDVWTGDKDDPCYLEGERLFFQNQQLVQQRPIPLSDAARQAENQNLITSYQHIQGTHVMHLRDALMNNQTNAAPSQSTPMPPPSSHVQARPQGIQHALPSNPQFRPGRSSLPPNMNPQLMQHALPGNMGRTSPMVQSQPFLQEQHGPLVLQDLSRAVSISPNMASHSLGPQVCQSPALGNSGFPGVISPLGYGPHQHRQHPSNLRSPTDTWSPPPFHPGQTHRVHHMQFTRNSPNTQAASPKVPVHSGQMTGSNSFVPQSAPRANALARPIYEQPLLPVNGQTLSTTAQPNPTVTALHQYQARSPIFTTVDQADLRNSVTKYFRYVKGVTVLDDRLKIGSRQNLEWNFNINEDALGLLSGTSTGEDGSLSMRTVTVGSAFCQVRCIDATTFAGAINQSDWVVARQVWPSHITVLLNGQPLDIRKKIHYGRDLPVDITTSIQKGTNTLSVSMIRGPKEDESQYAIGVESIRLLDSETAKTLTGVLPYEEARQRILQRLQSSDPEIEVVDAYIILNMTDPHTSRIWDIPMRGKTCLHDQCFDLDTFLQTRSSKRPGQPCEPDQFKCPICDADARPQSLVKDELFLSLREALVRMDRLDAKAIIMKQDGSWRIKEEEKTGESGDGSDRLSRASSKKGAVDAAAKRDERQRKIETIEID